MAKKATTKAKEPDEKTPKEPMIFQPLTEKADYPALVVYIGPSDSTIGVVKEEGATPAYGGYYSKTFESMINGIDKCLFAYKVSNTQRNNMRIPELIALLEEHNEFMEKLSEVRLENVYQRHNKQREESAWCKETSVHDG